MEILTSDASVNRITGDELARFVAAKRCLTSLKKEGCSTLGGFALNSSSLLTISLSDLRCLSKMVFNCPNLNEIALDFSLQGSDSTDLVSMVENLGRSCPRLQSIHIASVRLSHGAVLALTDANLSTEATTLEASKNPMRRQVQVPSRPSRSLSSSITRIVRQGSESPSVDANGNSFDFTTKLLHLAWHPSENSIACAAANNLSKFACTDNYLHLDHSKAIVGAGGAKHLVQLVYFGEKIVQPSALILLCYIALHVPDSEELDEAEVLPVLEWASKQAHLIQEQRV